MHPRHLVAVGLLSLALPLMAEETTPAPSTPPAETTSAEDAPPTATDDAAGGAQTEAGDATPAERVSPPETSVAQAEALANQLASGEQQQLKAGDESFLALWLPANSAEPAGLIVLVPGDGESADWPKVISPLRKKLPDAGWSSLSLTLPDPRQAEIPARPTQSPATTTPEEAPADAAAEQPAGEAAATGDTPAAEEVAQAQPAEVALPPSSHEQRVLARIEAGLTAARQQKPKRLILLGHGTGAYWAARYLAERKPADVPNLLLVAAQAPTDSAQALDEAIIGLKLATGDFYYKDQAEDRQAALRRMQAGKRQQHPAYVQVAMKALPGNPEIESEQLFRRIRGWLSLQPEAAAAKP